MWVNRTAKYPYVSRETWWTRYWLLNRKVRLQRTPTVHDRRVALILCEAAQRPGIPSSPQGAAALKFLCEVYFHGTVDGAPKAGAGAKA